MFKIKLRPLFNPVVLTKRERNNVELLGFKTPKRFSRASSNSESGLKAHMCVVLHFNANDGWGVCDYHPSIRLRSFIRSAAPVRACVFSLISHNLIQTP